MAAPKVAQQSASPKPTAPAEAGAAVRGFANLIALENDGLFRDSSNTDSRFRSKDDPLIVNHIAADEPRVLSRAADVVGLALSGGGIRSATFNLGLLQGLHRLGVLPLFDYLSTVSGGGYVGAFWSEWLARQQEAQAQEQPQTPPKKKLLFPTFSEKGSYELSRVDTDQERHLREFSGFLAPRWGFFEVETWSAVVAVLAGLVPALLIGLSVIGTLLLAWLMLTLPIAITLDHAGELFRPLPLVVTIAALTIFVLWGFESTWQKFKNEIAGGKDNHVTLSYWCLLVWAIVPVMAGQYVVGWWSAASTDRGLLRWWKVIVPQSEGTWIFSPRLFDFGLSWLFASGVLVMIRLWMTAILPPKDRTTLAAFDRVLMRLLLLATSWFTIAALWHISINLEQLIAAAVASVVSAGVFASLRNWIGRTLRRPAEAGVTSRLKPYLPAVLAYLTIALIAVVMGGVLIRVGKEAWWWWWVAAFVMLVLLAMALWIRTDDFGLHAFYRERISRAFTGACNIAVKQHANDNRDTETKDKDDRDINTLVDRPLHLVCCAANDLIGDPVETLERGARSAVLSKYGFSVGTHFRPWVDKQSLRLGSAITASAAAFNSAMGQISVRVGPAVSFLMTMLNLRLGLWIPHPAVQSAQKKRCPGILLYREMFALTRASGRVPPDDLHLSDGGHFDNLALYELVRRHCRYILVSDCGADPEVAFDDLGNALRRVREDFGVDISLDVAALRPGESRLSRQHVAVGTIHYSPTDRGILLYVKPSITGHEPTDVLQYRTRNIAFPHESTGNQFYDEAQWESYRRLGLHAAESVFGFVARDESRALTADRVFAEARHRWGPTPEGLESSVLEMTRRFDVLETDLGQGGTTSMLSQLFPETAHVTVPAGPSEGLKGEPTPEEEMLIRIAQLTAELTYAEPAPELSIISQESKNAGPASDAERASELAILMRVVQIMEDTWLTCQLDDWWSHPLNLGWTNYFARWATAPSFRFWWPVMSPMCTPAFRNFIEDRYPMPAGASSTDVRFGSPQRGKVSELDKSDWNGLAATWWQTLPSIKPGWFDAKTFEQGKGQTIYQHKVRLTGKPEEPVWMQVGLVGVLSDTKTLVGWSSDDSDWVALVGWSSDDFFVPPSLWGAAMGWHFLDELLRKLAAKSENTHCYVVVKAPPEDANYRVTRDDRRRFIEQYREIGFRQVLGSLDLLNEQFSETDQAHKRTVGGDSFPVDRAFATKLGYDDSCDTLFVLDLKQWLERQRKPTS